MFGKSGDKAARKRNGAHALQRDAILSSLWKNKIARSVVGVGATTMLVATMMFGGGGFSPAMAFPVDPQESGVEEPLLDASVVADSTEELAASAAEAQVGDPDPKQDKAPVSEVPAESVEEAPQTPAKTDTPKSAESANPNDQLEAPIDPAETGDLGNKSDVPSGNESVGAPVEMAAVGPDGALKPYVHWNVVDNKGTPVPGATFTFERWSATGWRPGWTGNRTVKDCVSSDCKTIDRDSDPGEYLVKWIDSENPGSNPNGNTIAAGGRYQIKPVNPPAGYEWVTSTDAVDSNSNTLSWTGSGQDQILNFGEFVVRKSSFVPICEAGYVYGLSGAGQLQGVSPTGTVTNVGQAAKSVSSFNGLGIGAGGSPVFAYERSTSTESATIYRYDVNTGTWTNTNVAINSTQNSPTVQFVAGAVNLDTGRYFIGGYTAGSDGKRVFRLWEYNPSTNAAVYKGYIATDLKKADTANGDIAFDSNGNLFVVSGTGTNTTVYSVTAENLAKATSGGLIPSSGSKSFTTMKDVNGVAFDADGKGYLSSGTTVYSYDMPGWTNSKEVTKSLKNSTDLASCSSPPTITIEKFVEGGRVDATDQFNLTLRQGGVSGTEIGTEIGTATTTGNANGLQDERVGPLPTVRGIKLHFSESAAGTTNLSNYASSYRCLVDGDQTVQGAGTSGSIEIPAGGQSVECRFYNSPLIAQVNVHKQVTDSKGENPEPGTNWSVGATATATTGTITASPNADTQPTNTDGTASWKFAFGGSNNKANLSVKELMQDGYGFKGGTCEVTNLDGTTKKIELSGAANNPNVVVVPGDVVDCTFVNSLKPAKVSVGKQLQDSAGQNPKPAAGWTVGATLDPSSSNGVTISTPETAKTTADGKVAKPWVIDFPTKPGALAQVKVQETMQDGYDFVGSTCVITAANGTTHEQALNAVSGVLTGLAPGDSADCTFTNKPKSGTVTWEKVDVTGSALRGSEWKLTGPGSNGATTEITDCVATEASKCSGPDKEPKAGGFKLSNLQWGSYTLVETKAPAGYVLDPTVHEFTLGGAEQAGLIIDLGKIENDQQPALSLPLTGGVGSQTFFIGGGAILLAALAVLGIRRRKGASQ